MAYNHNEYQKEYTKKKLVMVMVRLNKEYDKDIIEALDENKAGSIKRLIRMGLSVKKNI